MPCYALPCRTFLSPTDRQLPSSATTLLSRDLQRRLRERGTTNPALPWATTTPGRSPSHEHQHQDHDHRGKPSLPRALSIPASVVESWDRGANGVTGPWASGCELVGLEEEVARREGAEEKKEERRGRIEATRRAVCEALALWSSKADLLQVGTQWSGCKRGYCTVQYAYNV